MLVKYLLQIGLSVMLCSLNTCRVTYVQSSTKKTSLYSSSTCNGGLSLPSSYPVLGSLLMYSIKIKEERQFCALCGRLNECDCFNDIKKIEYNE